MHEDEQFNIQSPVVYSLLSEQSNFIQSDHANGQHGFFFLFLLFTSYQLPVFALSFLPFIFHFVFVTTLLLLRDNNLLVKLTFLTIFILHQNQSQRGFLTNGFFLNCSKKEQTPAGVIYIYIRTFLKFGIKIRSQKKVIRVQSRDFCISAGDFGTL